MLPKYINNGTFGCVMAPGISCKSKNPQHNTVSKLFSLPDKSSEEVILHKKIIGAIDPKNIFTTDLKEHCDIPTKVFDQNEIKKCRNFTMHDTKKQSLPQILYEYGGFDLMESCRRYMFDELFQAMAAPFKGLIILGEKNYVHLDIKPENMVYNSDTKKMSIIDFGLASTMSDVYRHEKLYILQHTYPYYPPEFLVAANLYKKGSTHNLMQNYAYLSFMIKKLYVSARNIPNEVLQELQKLNAIDVDDLVKAVNNGRQVMDPTKIDIYMLGVSLFEILEMCVIHNKVDFSANPKFYARIIKLIRKMVDANPITRCSPEDALVEYSKIVRNLGPSPITSPPIISPIKINRKHKSPKPLKKDQKQLQVKVCPPGKVLNPLTNRCVKVVEEKVSISQKPCPPGQVRNPVTKRCRKIVPEKPDIMQKPCPPGKVRNPVTKRCRKAP